MDKTYRCPKCGDSKAKYDYGLRNFVCPIDYTTLSEYQQKNNSYRKNAGKLEENVVVVGIKI